MTQRGTLLLAKVAAKDAAVRTNWAGCYRYGAAELAVPETVEAVQDLVRSSTSVKALGTTHSFHGIADTAGRQMSLARLDKISLDRQAGTVTVGAGVSYGQLAPWLHAQGFAVHNLASLPHISVAGACATATHGSGVGNGCLSTAVVAMEFVDGRGEVVRLSRAADGERMAGAVVGLGALGVTTSLTLEVQPAFAMRQTVYENLSFAVLRENLETVLAGGYSVSLFTDWQQHRATQVWVKERVEGSSGRANEEFFGAARQKKKLHPLPHHAAKNCTEQQGIAGPWHERLPHFRMEFTPSSGAELQTEYFVPRERGYEAILAVERLRDRIGPHLLVSELRAVAADKLWLSMAYERPALGIHFTWKPHLDAVQQLLPEIEEALAPFEARPHWAKLFAMPAGRLERLYPKLHAFAELREQYDPENRFANDFLRMNLPGR